MDASGVLRIFKWAYVACIAGASVQPFLSTHETWILVLASTELLGLAGLAWHRTRWLGFVVLLGVFLIASAHEVISGQLPFRFGVYAIAAWLIAATSAPFVDAANHRPRPPLQPPSK